MSNLPRPDQLPPGPDAERKRTTWSRKREIPKLWHWGELGKVKRAMATRYVAQENGDVVLHLTSGTVKVTRVKRSRRPTLEDQQAELERKMEALAQAIRALK